MKDLLRLTNLVGIDILKKLLNGQIWTRRQLTRELDVNSQDVGNALVHLKKMHMVDNTNYGEYTITELGKDYLDRLSQLSHDQSSRRTQT